MACCVCEAAPHCPPLSRVLRWPCPRARAPKSLRTRLTPNCELDIAKLLIVHQSVHTISPAKSRNRVGAMLINAANEIVCDPDVKRAANVTGEDVDPIASVETHSAKP